MISTTTIVEVVDVVSGTVEWTGPYWVFVDANADMPLSSEEQAHLAAHAEVFVGGGAAAEYCVRLRVN